LGDFDPARESFPVITNRHGLQVFVKVLEVSEPVGIAYLVHGFSDVHDTPHMRALTGAFVAAGYNVVVWDATHSWGRSGGSSEQASFYHHHEDLEDVIEWSRGEPWFQRKFALAGHSLGGMVAGTYAAAHPEQVTRLVLVSPVVSGPGLRRRIPAPVRAWWRWRGMLAAPRWGMSRSSWEFIRSTWSYDLLRSAHRLTMPTLVIGAQRDVIVPPRLVRRLGRLVPAAGKQVVIVPGARHGFDRDWEMAMLGQMVEEWLRNHIKRPPRREVAWGGAD
jgi:pimeloyl-ACP methyl ester carboxylesterase